LQINDHRSPPVTAVTSWFVQAGMAISDPRARGIGIAWCANLTRRSPPV
jgi:hypothetical protein